MIDCIRFLSISIIVCINELKENDRDIYSMIDLIHVRYNADTEQIINREEEKKRKVAFPLVYKHNCLLRKGAE